MNETKKRFNPYPEALFEERPAVPNIAMELNSDLRNDGKPAEISRRYFLPIITTAEMLSAGNVIFTGDRAGAYPELEYALGIFYKRVRNILLRVHPGEIADKGPMIGKFVDRVDYRLGPWSGKQSEKAVRSEIDNAAQEIEGLKSVHDPPWITASLYTTSFSLRILGQLVEILEKAGFDRLEFFPANLFIAPDNTRRQDPSDPDILLEKEEIKSLEGEFWEMLEEKYFRSRLFDLNISRRQLERTLNYYAAAKGKRDFEPPHCRASRLSLYIDANCGVRVCPFQPTLGNLKKTTLRSISESETLRNFRANMKHNQNPICPPCAGDYPHQLRRSK